MAGLTKNAISEMVRDGAKRTIIWYHKVYKSNNQYFQKFKMADLSKKAILVTARDGVKRTKIF